MRVRIAFRNGKDCSLRPVCTMPTRRRRCAKTASQINTYNIMLKGPSLDGVRLGRRLSGHKPLHLVPPTRL